MGWGGSGVEGGGGAPKEDDRTSLTFKGSNGSSSASCNATEPACRVAPHASSKLRRVLLEGVSADADTHSSPHGDASAESNGSNATPMAPTCGDADAHSPPMLEDEDPSPDNASGGMTDAPLTRARACRVSPHASSNLRCFLRKDEDTPSPPPGNPSAESNGSNATPMAPTYGVEDARSPPPVLQDEDPLPGNASEETTSDVEVAGKVVRCTPNFTHPFDSCRERSLQPVTSKFCNGWLYQARPQIVASQNKILARTPYWQRLRRDHVRRRSRWQGSPVHPQLHTPHEGFHESRRCSRDTYAESYITQYTSIQRYRNNGKVLRCTQNPERLVFYCRTTGAGTAPCTSRRMCCPTYCASCCTPCQSLLRAFFGWICFPHPTPTSRHRFTTINEKVMYEVIMVVPPAIHTRLIQRPLSLSIVGFKRDWS